MWHLKSSVDRIVFSELKKQIITLEKLQVLFWIFKNQEIISADLELMMTSEPPYQILIFTTYFLLIS